MFFNNYSKPGKGVNKRDPNQPKWQVFLDVFPRKLWDLVKLNMLYLLVALPFFALTMVVSGVITGPVINEAISTSADVSFFGYDILLRIAFSFLFTIFIGLGPATSGFVYIIKEHASERPCMLLSDFFKAFKSNFKQSMLLWIIDLIVLYVFTVAIRFYGDMGKTIFQYVFMVVSLMYVMMHIYTYRMITTFDLPLKHILKNSFLISLGNAPINLIIVACNALIYIIIPIYILMYAKSFLAILITILVGIFVFPAITYFITEFCVSSILGKYIDVEGQ